MALALLLSLAGIYSDTQVPVDTDFKNYVPQDLGVEDYQTLQKELYAIGKQANKSIVTVTGVTSSMDWFNTPYESQNQAAGVIIANNGQELLILTEKKVIVDAQSLSITFNDKKTVLATLKKYDGNTGIAIISVALTDISEDTLNRIEEIGRAHV